MLDLTGFPKNKIFRYEGNYYKNHGALGCAQSHIGILKDFLVSDDDFCIILEDDFRLNEISELEKAVQKASAFQEWDVIMLSGNLIKHSEEEEGLVRVQEAQTTSGYIVSKKFAPTLLTNFREAENGLLESGTNFHDYCIDQYWKKLQPISRWFSVYPKIGYQESGFSDIEGRNVSYLLGDQKI
jgi:GR25 family glycosyltransferase involved in LPS biosynthesis